MDKNIIAVLVLIFLVAIGTLYLAAERTFAPQPAPVSITPVVETATSTEEEEVGTPVELNTQASTTFKIQ